MARLAEYMQQLSAMFGEIENVHFVRVDDGSTRLVARVDGGAPSQRVNARIRAIRDSTAPEAPMRAYRKVDEMVAEDGGPAKLTNGAGATVLRFPGLRIQKEKPISLIERGTVTGRLYALMEEPPGELKARIRPRDGSNYIACTAEAGVGRELRNFFMDAVRAFGRGTWTREENGEWICRSLHIENVQPVKDVSLREAINALRNIEANWSADPLGDWAALEERNGAA